MSGGYVANAGGIFVAGNAAGIPEEVDRHINLMIYQLASYMNAKDYGANIQNAVRRALGGEPHPGEIQATPITESDPAGYFATDIRVNNGADHAVTVGVSPAVTYFPESDPNLYYILNLQDLSLILTILQLADDLIDQTVWGAASAALQTVSGQLQTRAEQQGWKRKSAS